MQGSSASSSSARKRGSGTEIQNVDWVHSKPTTARLQTSPSVSSTKLQREPGQKLPLDLMIFISCSCKLSDWVRVSNFRLLIRLNSPKYGKYGVTPSCEPHLMHGQDPRENDYSQFYHLAKDRGLFFSYSDRLQKEQYGIGSSLMIFQNELKTKKRKSLRRASSRQSSM